MLTKARVLDLPPSLTGLGLDKSEAEVRAVVAHMDAEQVRRIVDRFCSGWPGEEPGSACVCGAMGAERHGRRVEAHFEAEELGAERVMAWWAYERYGPDMPFNGQSVREYVLKFKPYDPG